MKTPITFSQELKAWLKSDKPKNIKELDRVFGERGFAVFFVLLMSFSALPIPTGGISHLFQAICMIIAIEMLLGFKVLWLPLFIKDKKIPDVVIKKGLPQLAKRLEWVEQHSKPRSASLLNRSLTLRLTAVLVFIFTFGAFLAPPFSGLDTLPSLGVVALGLGLLVGDIAYYIFGVIIGSLGVVLEFTVGKVVFEFLGKQFDKLDTVQKVGAVGIVILLLLLFIAHSIKNSKKS